MIKPLLKAATFDKPGANWLVAGIVVLVAVTFSYAGFQFLSASAAGARIYLQPAKSTAALGSTFVVDVRGDALGETVNAAQVNVTYPANKLRYDGYDAQGGVLEVQANAENTPGTVRIARGTVTSTTGDFKILSLRFSVIGTGKADLSVDPTSALVRQSDATDILTSYGSARFKLSRK